MKQGDCPLCGKSIDDNNATFHAECQIPTFLDYFFYRWNGRKKARSGEDERGEKTMKIDYILNDEDMKEVKDWIDELLKKKDLEIGDNISSGGLGVMLEDKGEKNYTFAIYREIGLVAIKKLINE